MKEFLTFAIDNYAYGKRNASKLQKQRINKRKDKLSDAVNIINKLTCIESTLVDFGS